MKIKTRAFKCDPRQFGCRAACCRSADTKPALTVGDYLRMSTATGESLSQLWLNRGNVNLTLVDKAESLFILTLGLRHDPCTFLSPEAKCKIYAMRPLACGSFPWYILIEKPEELLDGYSDLKCLKNVRNTPAQAELWRRMRPIMRTEAEAELRHFWTKGPSHISAKDTTIFYHLYKYAREYLAGPKPSYAMERVPILEEAIKKMETILKMSGRVVIPPHKLANLAQNVLFFWAAEAIAKQLDELTPAAKEAYKSTTEAWQEISLQV